MKKEKQKKKGSAWVGMCFLQGQRIRQGLFLTCRHAPELRFGGSIAVLFHVKLVIDANTVLVSAQGVRVHDDQDFTRLGINLLLVVPHAHVLEESENDDGARWDVFLVWCGV